MTVSSVFFIADDALGVRLGPETDRHALAKRLRLSGDWRDVIPGVDSICVQYDPLLLAPNDAIVLFEHALASRGPTIISKPKDWVIPVCYAPEFALDMREICGAAQLSIDEIIKRHTETIFEVYMMGFTPGFAYLKSSDFALDLPRLKNPRQHVPTGSVGLAAGQCGLYALDGPGGWPIVGRTSFHLFDLKADDPFRLNPGDRVKFEPVAADAFGTETR